MMRNSIMGNKIIRNIGLILAVLLLSVSCDREEDEITWPGGPVMFTLSPVATSAISSATPLGNLNPPGHTVPSNHMGFYLNVGTHQVCAMAAGRITRVYYNTGSDDYDIEFRHTSTCRSYLGHVENPTDIVAVGIDVEAGDNVGWATSYLDIGVIDDDITRYFIVPGRYHENTIHAGDVYLYCSDEVRENLLAKNRRTAEPRGGKIDFDIDGALSGCWFLEGTPVTYEASSYLYGVAQISFVYDMWDPSKLMIACGGTWSAAPFCCPVNGHGSPPDFGSVTPSRGLVKYETTHAATTDVVCVQLLESRRLKVEVFANKTYGAVTGFTTNARIYIR